MTHYRTSLTTRSERTFRGDRAESIGPFAAARGRPIPARALVF
jgi:hypothetical protein